MFINTRHKIRNIFFAGLLVTLPIAVSVYIFRLLFVSIDAILSPGVTRLLILLGVPITHDFRIHGLGLVASVLLVFLVGLFTRNIVGRKMVELGERIFAKIPIFRNIYTGAKQIIETFGENSSKAFKKVAMIEYPRKGLYALVFITSESKGEVQRITSSDVVNVFLPTTPNPTSGFFLLVPREDIIVLDMTVEEGIKLIISGGLVTPPDRGVKSPKVKE